MRTAIILGTTTMLLTSTAMAWVFSSDDGAGATPLRSRVHLEMAERSGPEATAGDDEPGSTASARTHRERPSVTREQERPELPAAVASDAPDLRLPTALPKLPERDPSASATGAYARAAAIIDRVEQAARTSIRKLEKLRERHTPIETVFQDELRRFAAEVDTLGEDYKAIEPLLSDSDKAALEADGKARLDGLLARFQAVNKMPEPQVDSEPKLRPHRNREPHDPHVKVETIIE